MTATASKYDTRSSLDIDDNSGCFIDGCSPELTLVSASYNSGVPLTIYETTLNQQPTDYGPSQLSGRKYGA